MNKITGVIAKSKLIRAVPPIEPNPTADEAAIEDDKQYGDKAPQFFTTTAEGASDWFDYNLRKVKREGIFITQEILTAAMARLLLDNNDDNRPISAMKVKEMVTSLQAGAFDSLNGETIQISRCGRLNDGQHRLHAKLESAVDQPFLFLFGTERGSRLTLDQGRQRTAGDYLTMGNYEMGAKAAGVAMLLHAYLKTGVIKSFGGQSKDRLSTSQRAAFAREHYEQISASLRAIEVKPGVGQLGGLSLLAFAHLLFAEKHFAGATDFINKLISGADLAENSPINNLRRRLTTEKRLRREERMELIVRAWNAWRHGNTPKNLLINGTMPEIAE